MEEVLNQSVEQEVALQETSGQEGLKEVVQEKPDTGQADNFKRLRLKAKSLEDELRVQKELVNRLLSREEVKTPREVDELDSVDDSEYIPKGKVKQIVSKEAAKIARQIAQEETKALQDQYKQAIAQENFKRKYPDFDDIVTPESVALLEEKEPELAQTIAELKDPYKMGIQAYTYIKALGIKEKAPDARRMKEAQKLMEKNEKTVQSPMAYEKRPMAQAFELTEARKQELYREMTGYAARSGGGL